MIFHILYRWRFFLRCGFSSAFSDYRFVKNIFHIHSKYKAVHRYAFWNALLMRISHILHIGVIFHRNEFSYAPVNDCFVKNILHIHCIWKVFPQYESSCASSEHLTVNKIVHNKDMEMAAPIISCTWQADCNMGNIFHIQNMGTLYSLSNFLLHCSSAILYSLPKIHKYKHLFWST